MIYSEERQHDDRGYYYRSRIPRGRTPGARLPAQIGQHTVFKAVLRLRAAMFGERGVEQFFGEFFPASVIFSHFFPPELKRASAGASGGRGTVACALSFRECSELC